MAQNSIQNLTRRIRRRLLGVSPVARANLQAGKFGEPPKAAGADYLGRFREIVSDPLNLLIARDPLAGFVLDGKVVLHNGIRVPAEGQKAYYGEFSHVLIINRGVHEPLEEYAFQEVLARLTDAPAMLELGAYWGHYSMWCQHRFPSARNWLVEPEQANLQIAIENFAANGFKGEFIPGFVGKGHFEVDRFMKDKGLDRLAILHSDIQGFELEMLEGASSTLSEGAVDWIFISTHSQMLHEQCINVLQGKGYRIEVEAGYDAETTSNDGFILAAQTSISPLFRGKAPLGRVAISQAKPAELLRSVAGLLNRG